MIRRTLLAHVEIMRPYTVFYVGLVGLAGALWGSDEPNALRIVGASISPVLGWLAGLYGSDYFDRRLDAIAKPSRPIPSGRISARVAFAFMALYIVVGLTVALLLGWANLLVALAVLVLGVSYSKVLKARGIAGHFVRGVPMGLTFVFGMLATSGQVKLELLPLSFIFFFHDASTNMVGAIRDMEGDRAGGYLTFPARYGVTATLGLAGSLYAGAIALALFYPLVLNIRPIAYYSLLAVTASTGTLAYVRLWRQRNRVSRAAALGAHKILVLERLFLACALIGAAADWLFALAVLLPSLAITWLSQSLLRDRYEFPGNSSKVTGTVQAEKWSRADIVDYVERQLSSLRPDSLNLLRNWPRRLEIKLVDRGFAIYLLVEGTARQISEAVFQGSSCKNVTIQTDTSTFQAIFIDRTSSPHHAYLQGRIRLQCSPLDMVRLNQIFNAFRQQGESIPARDERQIEQRDISTEETADGRSMHGELDHQVVVSDTTLRDGEQMPGTAFGIAEKVALAQLLDELGVPLLEVGFPAVSGRETAAIKEVVQLGLQAVIQVIARPLERDIDAALFTGAGSIAIFIGTSDAHVVNKLRTSRSALVEQVARAIAYAKTAGVQVAFAPEDATRTPLGFLREICRVAIESEVDVIAIPDTAGVMTPWAMQALIHSLAKDLTVPLAVHCHNDLGLATANSIAGLLAGASGVQCSLAGIGERAGNAPLEEVATILEIVYECNTGLNLARLTPAAQELARMLGRPPASNKAIVGANAFVHNSGLHTDGVIRDPTTYEPFAPERVGQQRRFVFGKHAGKRGLQYALELHGLTGDEMLYQQLLDQVKKMGEASHPLDEAGLVHLALALGAERMIT